MGVFAAGAPPVKLVGVLAASTECCSTWLIFFYQRYVAEKFLPDMHLLASTYLPDMFLMDGEWDVRWHAFLQ